MEFDSVVCIITWQRISEELDHHFPLKLWIHHHEVRDEVLGVRSRARAVIQWEEKCNLPAATPSADPRPKADGIQFKIGGLSHRWARTWSGSGRISRAFINWYFDYSPLSCGGPPVHPHEVLEVWHCNYTHSDTREKIPVPLIEIWLASSSALKRKKEFSITGPFIAAATW